MRIFANRGRSTSANDHIASEANRLRARIRYFLEGLRNASDGESFGEEGEDASRVDCARFSLDASTERRDERQSSRLGSPDFEGDDSDDDDLLSMWIED